MAVTSKKKTKKLTKKDAQKVKFLIVAIGIVAVLIVWEIVYYAGM